MNLELTAEHAFAQRIFLEDFRNYRTVDVLLTLGRNVFVGQNGQGKSNLLESLYSLSSTRSFRGGRDKDVIRHGQERARVMGVVGPDASEISLEYQRTGGRRAFLFEKRLPRVLDLVGRLPSVVFSAADLAIIDGGPADRREFLDAELSLLSPSYLKAITGYRKAVEHRNAALRAVREGRAANASISPWDVAVAERGAVVRQARADWLESLVPFAAREHASLSGVSENLAVEYIHADECESSDELRNLLEDHRQKDLAAGHTTVGPHRDDLRILLDGQEARAFASQGQRRTIALALKLGVAHYWRERMRVLPMILLDDIMSDLDSDRRHAVMAVSGSLGQVVITTTDLDALRPEVGSDAKVFRVRDGLVCEE